jgi:uncharacterized protein (DUF433 family)
VVGGKPCIRGMRVTVGTIVGLMASGKTIEEVLAAYLYIEREDVLRICLWCPDEISDRHESFAGLDQRVDEGRMGGRALVV